jgi:predicted metalloprotease
MRLDQIGESANVEDRRGAGGRFPGGRGGLGLGAVLILTLIGWATGINPGLLIGGAELVTRGIDTRPPSSLEAPATSPEDAAMRQFVARVLKANEEVWAERLPIETRTAYQPPKLVLFTGATRSACGGADAAMGPFYCPIDQRVYLDTSFFDEMRVRMRAGGDFAQAYVISHEIGHHIQNLLGILPKVQQAQARLTRREGNALSVRVELMADCLAGVWAHHANERWRILEAGDVEEALNAAAAIGDDKLQKQSQGIVVPDSFTHGSSAQRARWLTRGLQSGRLTECDTFNTRSL